MNDHVLPIGAETLDLDVKAARAIAGPYAETYRAGQPYPHICIDNFLDPAILNRVRADLASLPEAETAFDNAQERLKTSYLPERLPAYSRELFHALNSRAFIAFLEQMTGISGLIPDPYYMGGGIHRVANGGHLDIHADFNLHTVMKVERRLNVLIYLNPEWQAEWGGSFEIWDKQMKRMEKTFVPIFNRMVCFSTGSDTFHGNPATVANPNGDPRLSIALYYYTATWDSSRKAHSTIFKPRPGTVDEPMKSERRHDILSDVLPPIVYRRVAGPLRKLGF